MTSTIGEPCWRKTAKSRPTMGRPEHVELRGESHFGTGTMKRYKVIVNGENVLMEVCCGKGKYGFYVTRNIEARTMEEAEEIAVDKVRGDPGLSGKTLNEKTDPPCFFIFGIEESTTAEEQGEAAEEYSFYPEEGTPRRCCRAHRWNLNG